MFISIRLGDGIPRLMYDLEHRLRAVQPSSLNSVLLHQNKEKTS